MTAPRVHPDPQDPQDRHLDAGAYVLGLLDEADRAAFEAHLHDCARCTAEVAQLGELEPLLAEFRAGTPLPDPLPEPSPQLLDGLLGEVARSRRRSRSRRLVLVAAAAALIVGGPAVTAVVVDAGSAPVAQAGVLHSAIDRSGVSATVGVTDKGWGSAVTLKLDGLTGPRSCDLVAVSAEGQRQTVTSWSVAATGYGARPSTTGLKTSGGAGFHAADINHFEVRDLSSGQILVSIPATS